MKNLVFFLVVFLNTIICFSQSESLNYFDLEPPKDIPKQFNPDFIPDSCFVQNGCFSADGKEFYYIETDGNWSYSKLFQIKINEDNHHIPLHLFPDFNLILVPFVSPDNQKLFFISSKSDSIISGDIFVSERIKNGWSNPKPLAEPINSAFNEWEVSVAKNGTLYFSSDRPNGYGTMDIYKSEFKNGQFQEPINLGKNINTESLDECAYIAPDESYMIFNSWKEASQKGNNLYISFNKNDEWTKPLNLGDLINTDQLDIYPNVSPDGKYLFFTRREKPYGPQQPSKLYWVKTSFIDSLSKQAHHILED